MANHILHQAIECLTPSRERENISIALTVLERWAYYGSSTVGARREPERSGFIGILGGWPR